MLERLALGYLKKMALARAEKMFRLETGRDFLKAPLGTEQRVKTGLDFTIKGRDVDVDLVLRLGNVPKQEAR